MPTPKKAKTGQATRAPGPKFLRNTLVQLSSLSVDDPETGWRKLSQKRVDQLAGELRSGNFGLTVACGVFILEKEDSSGLKLIDDGVSTVKALLACQAYFAGEPDEAVPANIAAIFQNGLEVKVIQYKDDDDRQARKCWNVARHDEESNTVRWSSVAEKIESAMEFYTKHGDWAAAKVEMLEFYGDGKEQTIARWVRAAKGMDPATATKMKDYPDIKGTYIWDNTFLVTSSTNARDKMGVEFAAMALDHLVANSAELSAVAFKDKICKPLRVLEIWHTLMCKRYGSVAINSPALVRVMGHLSSWGGLSSIRRCIESGVVLQDPGSGIPECSLLVAEFDKRKAGGLPPPVRIPTEAERKAEEEAAKQAAEVVAENSRAAAEAKKLAEEAAALASEELARAAEADLLMLTSPGLSNLDPPLPGGIAGSQPQRSPEAVAAEMVQQRLKSVHFENTLEGLTSALSNKPELGRTRTVCLVEAPTTSLAGFGNMMDVAGKVWDIVEAAYTKAQPDGVPKFRLVILIGSRFDLIAKAQDKIKVLMPMWTVLVVQLQRRDRQSDRSRPTYAVLAGPASEMSPTEPTVVTLPKQSASETTKCRLNLRCTEARCLWRPEPARAEVGALATKHGSACEIPAEDKFSLIDATMADLVEEAGAGEAEEDEGTAAAAGSAEAPQRRDAIVDLWPFARTPSYYTEILTMLGAGVKATGSIVISASAHPSPWMACERMGMECWVFTRRWSEHSCGHGCALGKELFTAEALLAVPRPTPVSPGDFAGDDSPSQFIEAFVAQASNQVVEAYDIAQGAGWNEGINRSVPAQVLVPGSQELTRKEAEKYDLRVSGVTEKGRGLETAVARRDGETVCITAALFYDDWNTLRSMLKANPRFMDRVAIIDGVKRDEGHVTVWAVLVGIGQYVQHFAGYRTRPNAVLEFNPAEGFNSGSLRVVVCTRTGSGISAGSPVLLNYGAAFDFEKVRAKDDEAYFGALDKLFASQRSRLPRAAEENEKLKEAEEAARKAEAEAALKIEEDAAAKAAVAAEAQKHLEEEDKKRAAVAAERKAAEEAEKKQKREAVLGVPGALGAPEDPKRRRLEGMMVGKIATTSCDLVVVMGKLVVRNTADANKKLGADTILALWSAGSSLSSSLSEGLEYQLTFKSDVVDKNTMKRMKLDKYIRENAPVTDIFGYEAFPAGSIPKVLVKKGNKTQRWDYSGTDKATVAAAVAAARNCTVAMPLWVVRRDPAKLRVEPRGIAIVLMKAQQVAGGGELTLE